MIDVVKARKALEFMKSAQMYLNESGFDDDDRFPAGVAVELDDAIEDLVTCIDLLERTESR